MFAQLTEEDFTKVAQQNLKRVAVYKEIPSDHLSAVHAFLSLRQNGRKAAILESAIDGVEDQHSFIGFDPVCTFSSRKNKISIQTKEGLETKETENPIEELRKLKEQFHCENLHLPSSFMGGAIGFASYDAVRLVEKIEDRHKAEKEMPDLFFHFYDSMLIFDHKTKKLLVSTIVEKDGYQEGVRKLDVIIEQIKKPIQLPSKTRKKSQAKEFQEDLNDQKFSKMVQKAKDYIKKGDAYQIVLSREFQKEFCEDPFAIYRALRIINPSPYMFYLDCGDFQVAGASPEKLISVQNNIVQSTPIAGTKPRGKTPEEDEALVHNLLQDEKEISEHMMLVDLARNDVGKISQSGSVEVKELKKVQKFSHVMHITSVIEGKLKEEKDALDVFFSSFPAGTLTGAPKIRAMQIIDELEHSKRGLYGGGIIVFDSMGNLNSCIGIRMAVVQDQKVTVRAGCGVVYDSDPLLEAKETKDKAKAVLQAVELAEKEVL